jgi:cellulose synthase operon protein C
MRIRAILPLFLAAVSILRAQDALNLPVPLAPAPEVSSPAMDALTRQAANRAQQMGFPSLAAQFFGQLLDKANRYPLLPGSGAPARAELSLELATALLDDGRPLEARKVLEASPGPRGSAWHLRAGLADMRLRDLQGARGELDRVKPEELAAADRPWRFFLDAVLAGSVGDTIRSAELFTQAERSATTELERARFSLEREKARLLTGNVSARTAEEARQNAERFRGTATGYDFLRAYAVMLDGLGRKADAVAILQRQIGILPAQERVRGDDFRLLLGMIAGAADPVGQRALIQLIESGSDPARRRMGLQLLATASSAGPAHALFRAELDKLIAAVPQDAILEDLLLFRSVWALGDHDNTQAEDDAHSVLEKFPGSPLTGYARSVLTGSAWEQRRYRTAADDAFQARAALAPGEARSELGVVVAEAWYRAGDFRSAADAYEAALREPPSIVRPGELMFQLIKADIEEGRAAAEAGRADRADPLAEARADLDRLSAGGGFDPVDRWEAEWNFASALEQIGQTGAAYARLNRLLAPGATAGLPAELRARLAWLQAKLSLDAHEPAQTLRLVGAMAGSLAGIEGPLRTELESMGALLKARASFELGRDPDALGILARLRSDFPQSDAAVRSYIVEADHYVAQDKIVEAQQLLTHLADHFPDRGDFAPYALLQAALLAERLGQDKNLKEADKLIEALVTKYPSSPLVFEARLKQGDLLRRLNDFPKAQQVYESLRDNFPQNPEVIYAELALAECHNAQSANDPSHAESAIALFAELRDRVDAPVDLRIEAGFSLGYLYERLGQNAQAGTVWWRDVVSAFLLDPARAREIGGHGRYWMTRTLIELGELNEKQGRIGEARRAWQLVLTAGLPGASLAEEQLDRLGGRPPSR